MKKYLILILAIALLAGCNSKVETPAKESATEEKAAETNTAETEQEVPSEEHQKIYREFSELLEAHPDPATNPEYGKWTAEEKKAALAKFEDSTIVALAKKYNMSSEEIMNIWNSVKSFYMNNELPIKTKSSGNKATESPQVFFADSPDELSSEDLKKMVESMISAEVDNRVQIDSVEVLEEKSETDAKKRSIDVQLRYQSEQDPVKAGEVMKLVSTKVVKALQDTGITNVHEIRFSWEDVANNRKTKYPFMYSPEAKHFEPGVFEE